MSTEFSAFAPPSLDGAPTGPSLPAPTLPTSAPTPTLPQLPSIPAPAASTATSIPNPLAPLSSPSPQNGPPAPERSTRSFGLVATLIALFVGAAALAAYGFVSMSSNDTAEPAPPPTDTAATSPLLVPIEDARDVVADINDNSSEAELLEELGLDPTGNPLVDAEQTPSTAVAPAGHRFTWSYGTGDTATVTVDSTTGNFSFESSTGTHYRLVDGASFVRAGEAAPWSQVDADALETIQRLGLEQPITVDDITSEIEAIASEATSSYDDGTAFVSISIDDVQFAEQMPQARIAWLAKMGIPNPDTAPAAGSFIAADADVAADGETITSLTVTAGAWTSTYQLEELFDVAPLIETP